MAWFNVPSSGIIFLLMEKRACLFSNALWSMKSLQLLFGSWLLRILSHLFTPVLLGLCFAPEDGAVCQENRWETSNLNWMRATNMQYVERKTIQEWTPTFKIHYHTDSRNSHPLFSESQVFRCMSRSYNETCFHLGGRFCKPFSTDPQNIYILLVIFRLYIVFVYKFGDLKLKCIYKSHFMKM